MAKKADPPLGEEETGADFLDGLSPDAEGRSPVHHARWQICLALLAVAAPAAGLVLVAVAGPLTPMRLLALGALVCVASGVPLMVLWRRALMIDRLADLLQSPATAAQRRREPVARIASAFAALRRRLAAHDAGRDPARRDDPMTGLPNRATAMRRARDEISRARRTGQPFAVALVAIDIGPPTEDGACDAAQDRALRLMAELLMQWLRAYDVVARWEHDQFVALLPEAEVENAVGAIERVRGMAASGWSIRGGEPLPDVHGGVAVLQPDDATLSEIVNRAERALERARKGIGAAIQATPGPRAHPARLTPV
jgi:diguanylate cyclase (GGDEF)-like protein